MKSVRYINQLWLLIRVSDYSIEILKSPTFNSLILRRNQVEDRNFSPARDRATG
ncbi:hypothetical protein [Microcoleus sp. herbarium12]|uniref:hypothetical protein n=1 Tax=Microcoleus sp. herbarium12 TaxID=3055437 RepID=UPI002FD6EF01